MAAFRRAVALGARFIETDLRLTRDSRFVAIHDATVDRTTNGHGHVHRLTLPELRALDAGAWFSSEFAGERIPTLDEILAFAREYDVVFYLELKPGEAWGLEHAVVAALRDAREEARAVVLSFDLGILASVRKIDATLMTGYLFDRPQDDVVECALQIGVRQLAPRGDLVAAKLLKQARQSDLHVVAWTINDAARMQALAAVGVDGIMTDFPDRLVRVLKESAGAQPSV